MYNFVEKIVQLACSTTTRNEDETEQNRKSSFSSLILLLQKLCLKNSIITHTYVFIYACICIRFTHTQKTEEMCEMGRKKIKSPFFAYCTEKKKQLISLLQTFNTAPPDNISEPEKTKSCVFSVCSFFLPR